MPHSRIASCCMPLLLRLCLAVVCILSVSLGARADAAAGEAVVSGSAGPAINLGERFLYYEDPQASLDVEDLLHGPDLNWRTIDKQVPNFGYTASAYWFRVSIQDLDAHERRLLEISYSLLDDISVWFVSEGRIIARYKSGDHEGFSAAG